jgi:hypothetical protein
MHPLNLIFFLEDVEFFHSAYHVDKTHVSFTPPKPTTQETTEAAFTFYRKPKYFLFHPSHQIFKRIHETLNVGKKN